MRYHPDHLLLTAMNTATASAAAVGRIQSANWLSLADPRVIKRVLRKPDVFEACLPLLSDEQLVTIIGDLPNETRLVALDRSTRTSVMQALAAVSDMDDAVFDRFVEKGSMTALRQFLRNESGGSIPAGSYSAQQTLRVWERMFTRYKIVPQNIPASWTGVEIAKAFQVLTDALDKANGEVRRIGKNGADRAAKTVWKAAEYAEVVSDAQREAWFQALNDPFGPLEFYTVRGLDLNDYPQRDPESLKHLNSDGASSRMAQTYGDVTLLHEMEQIRLGGHPVAWFSQVLQLSPRRDELLGKIPQEELMHLLALKVPLGDILGLAEDTTTLFKDWNDRVRRARGVDFSKDIILDMPPAVATYVASEHKGAFNSEALADHLGAELGDNVEAWQFFWDTYLTWENSTQSLIDTALAVS